MKGKEIIKFLITYVVATLIRAITGVSFNPFFDKFDFILFIKDFGIWAITYIVVSLIVNKLSRQKVRN